MEKNKKPSFSSFFLSKRLNKKATPASSSSASASGVDDRRGGAWRWRWKHLKASAALLRWKRRVNLQIWLVDGVLFKIVSVFEAIVLVSTLCAFFVCCGCHF